MANLGPLNLPVATQAVTVAGTWLPTPPWYRFFLGVFQRISKFGSIIWSSPTGAGARTAFDMNWTTAVSNPPTQAEVTAIRDQVIAVQKRLGQLIIDDKNSGILG